MMMMMAHLGGKQMPMLPNKSDAEDGDSDEGEFGGSDVNVGLDEDEDDERRSWIQLVIPYLGLQGFRGCRKVLSIWLLDR